MATTVHDANLRPSGQFSFDEGEYGNCPPDRFSGRYGALLHGLPQCSGSFLVEIDAQTNVTLLSMVTELVCMFPREPLVIPGLVALRIG